MFQGEWRITLSRIGRLLDVGFSLAVGDAKHTKKILGFTRIRICSVTQMKSSIYFYENEMVLFRRRASSRDAFCCHKSSERARDDASTRDEKKVLWYAPKPITMMKPYGRKTMGGNLMMTTLSQLLHNRP